YFYLLDKLCDQIRDAVLDVHLRIEPDAKCVAKAGMILRCGEITSQAIVHYKQILRRTLKRIAYDDSSKSEREQQCEEIKQAVSHGKTDDDIGAGGLMLGYATDETKECMPLAVLLAHKLIASIRALEWNGTWPWVRPDGKTQVSNRLHTLVISVNYALDILLQQIENELMYLDEVTIYHLLPSEKFAEGGLRYDTLINNSLFHGGGAFSGKDPSQVDSSAAYAAQQIAKSLGKAGLCRRYPNIPISKKSSCFRCCACV
uniref:methionine adenosyltransferase n=1 Tax=Taeniopygia guttata TaxID=59729 RepID=A0A674HSM8_TAEGU